MMIGYLLVATAGGLVGAIVALMLGAGAWYMLAAYSLTGSVTMALAAALQFFRIRRAEAKRHATAAFAADTAEPATLKVPAGHQMRILAVDDDPFILDLIPLVCAKAGFVDVVTAASGQEALALIRNADQPFDCLLLDLDMPEMDGIELCARTRQLTQYKQAPIIMLTAMRDVQNMGDAFRAGATDYVTKPFDIESLGTRLTKAEQDLQQDRRESLAGPKAKAPGAPLYSPDLLAKLQRHGLGNLVDFNAFSSYLTRLPRKEITEVQVLALSVSEQRPSETATQEQQHFLALMAHFASVASGAFGADRSLMAFTDDATLLVAVNSDETFSPLELEIALAGNLHSAIAKRLPYYANRAIDVVVGTPVKPLATQSDRARATTHQAIGLMHDRTLPKQLRQFKIV
jgi:DNA-binding response OmpR family regulator